MYVPGNDAFHGLVSNLYPPFARGEKRTINVESCDVVFSTLGAITYVEHVIVCRDTVPLFSF